MGTPVITTLQETEETPSRSRQSSPLSSPASTLGIPSSTPQQSSPEREPEFAAPEPLNRASTNSKTAKVWKTILEECRRPKFQNAINLVLPEKGFAELLINLLLFNSGCVELQDISPDGDALQSINDLVKDQCFTPKSSVVFNVDWLRSNDALRNVIAKRDCKARLRHLLRFYSEFAQRTGRRYFDPVSDTDDEDDETRDEIHHNQHRKGSENFELFWKYAIAMVKSKFRPFRFLGMKAISAVFLEIANIAQGMLDPGPRGAITLSARIADRIFEQVFDLSHRDLEESVRLGSLDEVGSWLSHHPSHATNKKVYSYFKRLLWDRSALVREEAIKLLMKTSDGRHAIVPKAGLERFKERLLAMALNETAAGVQLAALSACKKMFDRGILQEDDMKPFGRLLFSADTPPICKAIVGDICNMYIRWAHDLDLIDVPDDPDASSGALNKSLWPVFDALAQFVQQNLEEMPIPERDSAIRRAVPGLWDSVTGLQDWHSLAELLLDDGEKIGCSGLEVSGTQLEDTLLVLLLAILSHTTGVEDWTSPGALEAGTNERPFLQVRHGKDKSERTREQISQYFAANLPRLITRYGGDPRTSSHVALLTYFVDPEMYLSLHVPRGLEHLFDSLLGLYQKHVDPLAVARSLQALHYLSQQPAVEAMLGSGKVDEIREDCVGRVEEILGRPGNLPNHVIHRLDGALVRLQKYLEVFGVRGQVGAMAGVVNALDQFSKGVTFESEDHGMLLMKALHCAVLIFAKHVDVLRRHKQQELTGSDTELPLTEEELEGCSSAATRILAWIHSQWSEVVNPQTMFRFRKTDSDETHLEIRSGIFCAYADFLCVGAMAQQHEVLDDGLLADILGPTNQANVHTFVRGIVPELDDDWASEMTSEHPSWWSIVALGKLLAFQVQPFQSSVTLFERVGAFGPQFDLLVEWFAALDRRRVELQISEQSSPERLRGVLKAREAVYLDSLKSAVKESDSQHDLTKLLQMVRRGVLLLRPPHSQEAPLEKKKIIEEMQESFFQQGILWAHESLRATTSSVEKQRVLRMPEMLARMPTKLLSKQICENITLLLEDLQRTSDEWREEFRDLSEEFRARAGMASLAMNGDSDDGAGLARRRKRARKGQASRGKTKRQRRAREERQVHEEAGVEPPRRRVSERLGRPTDSELKDAVPQTPDGGSGIDSTPVSDDDGTDLESMSERPADLESRDPSLRKRPRADHDTGVNLGPRKRWREEETDDGSTRLLSGEDDDDDDDDDEGKDSDEFSSPDEEEVGRHSSDGGSSAIFAAGLLDDRY